MSDSDMSWSKIEPIIIDWAKGHVPSTAQRQRIEQWTLAQPLRSASTGAFSDGSRYVWLLTDQNISHQVSERAALLQALVQRLDSESVVFPVASDWQTCVRLLWTLWLPLSQQISQQQKEAAKSLIQGILGAQGTGKTTLTKVLQLILESMGHRVACLSIDDLYLSYQQRQQLCQQDPRLIWRGPPGTHDVEKGIEILSAVKQANATDTIDLPQFDKSLHSGQGDRVEPLSIAAPDILLFEGWFVGTQPILSARISSPDFVFPQPIVTPDDQQFARDCNDRLRNYLPLWSLIDDVIVLAPQDYRFSLQWRQQAEQNMMSIGKKGLSSSDIVSFVTYFWKALHPDLFVAPLTQCSQTNGITSLVIELAEDHQPTALCFPL